MEKARVRRRQNRLRGRANSKSAPPPQAPVAIAPPAPYSAAMESTAETAAADLTLDEMRPLLAAALPAHVPFDGWTMRAVDAAAADLGIPAAAARLAFPGGDIDMIEAWLHVADAAMEQALDNDAFRARKVREKVATAIRTRLEQAAPHKEAVRRAVAIMALPAHAPRAAKRAWKTADAIWRAAGDTATDFNHYSKRALAASIYTATLLTWLDDDSDDHAATWAFLDRRIDNVMQFEKLKARVKSHLSPSGEGPSLSRFLGRLRYPVEG